MEVFSMLRYWRGGGGAKGGAAGTGGAPATTISVTNYDEGPFFDLEFSVPEEDEERRSSNTSSEEEEGRESTVTEIKWSDMTVSEPGRPSSNSNIMADDEDNEVVIKGRLVSVERSDAAVIFNDEPNEKHNQFPVSLLKSATRFRVFFLRSKKHSPAPAATGESSEEFPPKVKQNHGRFLTLKFKVEEVPFATLFTKDDTRNGGKAKESPASGGAFRHGLPEKDAKRAKIVAQRYLKAIKPLYHRVSKRNGEKAGFSDHLTLSPHAKASGGSSPGVPQPAAAPARQGSFPAGLRIVYKRLGKSRSASSSSVLVQSQRRDDSLLQQQDGIQCAIAHCKRSLNNASEQASPSS